ncbi:MAG TPA: hypothetical protein VEI02_04390 [Planctomycetota bacterium]|nr:hypothetical protein [Planctomycetota bacterium]
MQEFPRSVIERIGYYVYLLRDPRDGRPFYVGKGTGNRVFAHARQALEDPASTDKIDRIRAIRDAGMEIVFEVVRHGLTEDQAFEVESALIDVLGLDDLSNAVAGHAVLRRGRMTVAEIIAAYRAEPVEITEPSLLIIVNRLFERNIDADRLYEITRGNWALSPTRKDRAKFGIAVYRGLVRAVYRIEGWEPAQARRPDQKRRNRWRFSGQPAVELQHLIGGSVAAYLDPPSQSPIRYVGC